MNLSNYRDLSTPATDLAAGFQFEFFCERCGEVQRSAFMPYRRGQVTGWLSRLVFLFNGLYGVSRASSALSDASAASAKAEALAEAQAYAARSFHRCERCRTCVGIECWNTDMGICRECVAKALASQTGTDTAVGTEPARAGVACPHCQAPTAGGRFCPECGFDMASTHKSCPSCGATVARDAHFCTDCGHGF